MDSFKGLFVSTLVTIIIVGFGYSVYQISQVGLDFIWLGNSISYGVGLFYFAGIYLVATPRTSANMYSTWIPIILGLVLCIIGFVKLPLELLGLAMNITMLGLWYLYTFWATDFSSRDKTLLQVGKKMPNVLLETPEGNEIEIQSFFNAPAVFLFYRGNWCPFCMAQIKELAKEYQQIKEKGAALVFISPQSQKHTKSLAKKFDIPAQFLIDKDLKAATKLHLFHKNGTPTGMEVLGFDSDNILPTLIITDNEGVIRFADLTNNYRLRPEPSVYLELLKTL